MDKVSKEHNNGPERGRKHRAKVFQARDEVETYLMQIRNLHNTVSK